MKIFESEDDKVNQIIAECLKKDIDAALDYYNAHNVGMSVANKYKILRAINEAAPKVNLSECKVASLQEFIDSGNVMTEEE